MLSMCLSCKYNEILDHRGQVNFLSMIESTSTGLVVNKTSLLKTT